ncbi:MAG: asparagine--tRNA ligase [Phycisphaerales bacterium]|nr:asparagine--tRNA ligase [Phycisphaerales bacterium]
MALMSVAEAMRAKPGGRVKVRGWVRTRRDSKAGISFVAINDGSCFDNLQLVVPKELANYEKEVLHLTTGCSLEAEGELVASQGQGQSVEVKADRLTVVGWVEDPETYPASAKRHTFEYLREQAHLRVRTNTFGAVARVRNCLAQAIHRFFHERGFVWVHTPIITASDCEGAGAMFRVSTLDMMNLPRTRPEPGKPAPAPRPGHPASDIDYGQDFFGKESFLTVSGQLNVETYCCALSKVYTFGPTFRAENSNTSRHLAEFWMIEPEIAFADINDDATLAEEMLRYLFRAVLEERPDDMKFFEERIDKDAVTRLRHIIDKPFLRLPYTEGVEILQKAAKAGRTFEFPVEWGKDLQSEHERYLTEEHFKQPVILMHYPKAIKAFYMRLDDGCAPGRETVAAMDVLVPGIGEIIGGSQREERLERLDRRLDEMKLDKAAYWWYRDLRRYGTVPHAGFGLGFERLIQFVTGMQNIRDVIPFPRAPKQAEF